MAKVYIITSEGGGGHKAAAEDSVKQLTSGNPAKYDTSELETVFVMPPLQRPYKARFRKVKVIDHASGLKKDEIELDKNGNYRVYNAQGAPYTGNLFANSENPGESNLSPAFQNLAKSFKDPKFKNKILDILSNKGQVPKPQQKSWLQFFGIDVGLRGVEAWNKAQSSGDIKATKRLVSQQWISELLFGWIFRSNVLKYLNANPDTELVIDTQAQNTHQILRAVSDYNKKNKKNVQFLKRMTDLPNKADHFFLSLNKIRDQDLAYLTLEVPHAPGVFKEENDTNLAYYKSKCPNLFDKDGNSKCTFTFTDGPIKQPFKDILAAKKTPEALEALVPRQADMTLPIKVRKEGSVITEDYTIDANATVKSVMLGSQAAVAGTLAYVDAEMSGYKPESKPEYLFVFCGNNSDLFEKVEQRARAVQQDHSNLKIIPLINQEAQMIAKVYGRADTVILRAGGISCMEIEAAAHPGAAVFFHSEGQSDDEVVLAEDLIPWEAGNIEHVKATLAKNNNTVEIIRPAMYNQKLADQNKRQKIEVPKKAVSSLSPLISNLSSEPDKDKPEAKGSTSAFPPKAGP